MGAVLLAGAALRLWEYFGNASLWVDELALSESILYRPLPQLLVQPLKVGQAAPAGFLAAVKLSTMLFGSSALAMRLPALLFTLAGLGLFAAVARRMLSGWAAVFATGLFAFGQTFVHYGSEVKQYAGDIAVALLLLLVALDIGPGATRPAAFRRAAIAGAVGVWFSMPSAFVLAGLGAALLLEALLVPPRRPSRALLWTIAIWAAAAMASSLWNLTRPDPATRDFLYGAWIDSFVPFPLRRRGDLLWPINQVMLFWRWNMRYPYPRLLTAVTFLGFAMLWRRRRLFALLLAGPIVVTVMASAARFYPFKGRLTLFLVSGLLLLGAEGARWVARGLVRLHVPAPLAAACCALPPLLGFFVYHPVQYRQENRALFEYLKKRRRPGDAIYIPYDTIRALKYYGPRTGLDPSTVQPGTCHRGDLAAYLREIDRYRGRPRVWVIFAHNLAETQEQPTMRSYLRAIGRYREGIRVPSGSGDSPQIDMSTELFDLSDPKRLASTTAASFPLPAIDPAMVRELSCWPNAD